MTNDEINKSCHSLITGGKGCWHDAKAGFLRNGFIAIKPCSMCGLQETNPDYLNNKQDWADLIQFVVNAWEGWEEFMLSEGCEPTMVPVCFLKDQRALPEALARWKEEGG